MHNAGHLATTSFWNFSGIFFCVSLHGDVITVAQRHSWLAFKVTEIKAAH